MSARTLFVPRQHWHSAGYGCGYQGLQTKAHHAGEQYVPGLMDISRRCSRSDSRAIHCVVAVSEERRLAMSAYGAELISVPGGQMEVARDLAKEMESRGEGIVLDQFANAANPLAHTRTTGPELWAQTGGRVTHFVTSMGTTGTAMGTSSYLKKQSQDIQIVGLQPAEGASIAGIRRWTAEYMPSIFDASRVDKTLDISQVEAEETMRALARCEGIFAGVSSGGCVAGALRVAATVENATIVCIICDRGVRFIQRSLVIRGSR